MATTKIWVIKDTVSRVVDYAENPEKTKLSSIEQVIKYADDQNKVTDEDECCYLVTGVNCERETAAEEMNAVKERFGKTDGNVAYHAYQSFKTGEVDPQTAHNIGVELATKMWGDGYQVVVATHLNTGTVHNHFVVNSVNMWNGKKYNCDKGEYYRFRNLSDELCREHNLTVIKNPGGKTPRQIYYAEKNGEPTKYNVYRKAIDEAISMSVCEEQLYKALKKMGYATHGLYGYENIKYATIKAQNETKATRLFRLGEDYTPEKLHERMRCNPLSVQNRYADFMKNRNRIPDEGILLFTENNDLDAFVSYLQRKKYYLLAEEENRKRKYYAYEYDHYPHSLVVALLLVTLYLTGVLKSDEVQKTNEPSSYEMQREARNAERLIRETVFAMRNNIYSLEEVEDKIDSLNERLKALDRERKDIYNKLRRCKDKTESKNLKERRDEISAEMKTARSDLKKAQHILKDLPELKEKIIIEKETQRGMYLPLGKQQNRNYYR